MQQMIYDLIHSKYYQKLFEFDDVAMIYVGGSRILGCIDDRSDYDLMVVTKNKSNYSKKEFLLYKDKKIHWYFQCVDAFLGVQQLNIMNCVGLTGFDYIREELIIYKSPEYLDTINYLFENKTKIARLGDILGYRCREELINNIVSDGFISDGNKTKHLYMLCAMYYDIVGQDLDLEFLTKIKRIKWQDIDEKYLKQCVDVLKRFKEYMKTIDQEKEIARLIGDLNSKG